MDAVPAPRSGGIQSVERAVAALKVFGEDEPEFGVTELARRLNLHKSTISRLMATLEAGGFVQQDPRTGRYRLGLQLATLAGRALNQYDLRDVARGALHALARATGETCNLAVRDGDDAVNIDQALSTNPVKHLGWIGRRLPLHCSAAGKPLLAFAPRTDIERVLARPLAAYTPRTVTDPANVWREIERIRLDDVALAIEEFEPELSAAGAPVRDHRGEVIATITVSGPTFRVTPDRLANVAGMLRETADHLSASLGYRVPAPALSVAAVRSRPFLGTGYASPSLRIDPATSGVQATPSRPVATVAGRRPGLGKRGTSSADIMPTRVQANDQPARLGGAHEEERSTW
jgi:DNA-binding IclR family transcriptional regulator